MILVLDNYDSFTFNLVHYLQNLGEEVQVVRSDQLSASDAIATGADAFLISPGPGAPSGAGNSVELVLACAAARKPLLGVCLGHQCIAEAFGGRVERAPSVMHGKTSAIVHDCSGVFAGLPSPIVVARYHSLTLVPDALPQNLVVNARADDGTIQGLRHRELPIHGVQFHPESVASEHGSELLRNFLDIAQRSALSTP